ncbi:hypothetical protein [uncultured Selenomonas sp.]|uniref:hypothetical protein n=1 Tax=uncultured Selenomonas sp. TaxID=159275 RepID=UPI0028F0D87D|nr:hypothetical protein [uncultured Selenomonas sp.]
MTTKGNADITTKAAVAPRTIDIHENKVQDISALSRDTANALNELGRIFDKKSVESQKELVNVFREEAFRLAHNLPDDGSGRKTLIHAAIGGLISQLSGAGCASGAAGAGLNEALINNLKGLDPTLAQIISGVLGAAAAKAINGNATAGAISAASGTKYNLLGALPLALSDYILAFVGLSGYTVLNSADGQQLLMNATGEVIVKCNNLGEWMTSNGEEAFDYIGDTIEDIIYWASTGTPRNNKSQN